MSDDYSPATQESMASIIASVTQGLPGLMEAQNAQVLPQARTELNAAQEITPAYAKLLSEVYGQYAPELAKTGVGVERINREGAAGTDLAILQGAGGQLAREAQILDKELNPEFYKTREATSDKLGQLLSSINLDAPNVEAERLINQENVRSGNIYSPNATNTVANAMSFGSALEQRRNSLGNAINAATSFMQPSVSSFNPVVTALNRPSTNTGETRFEGTQKPSNQAYQSGSQLLGSATQVKMQENDINANRRDGLDRFNETLSGIGSIVSI